MLMPSSDHHQKQAEMLMALARSTKDREAAAELAAMAAEHSERANQEGSSATTAPDESVLRHVSRRT
jgi:hypothetical protein